MPMATQTKTTMNTSDENSHFRFLL
jgi:hypothetical protein